MIDINDVWPLVQNCTNVNWLHHLQSQVRDRLKDINAPAEPVCRTCGGKKQIIGRAPGKRERDFVPCPTCVEIKKHSAPLSELLSNATVANKKDEPKKAETKPISLPVETGRLEGNRILIVGGCKTGKTTLSATISETLRIEAKHGDDLIDTHDWSGASQKIAEFFDVPGPWIVEGVSVVRALRKWLSSHTDGKPCDSVVLLEKTFGEITQGQLTMNKGVATRWNEISASIVERGVKVVRGFPDLSHSLADEYTI